MVNKKIILVLVAVVLGVAGCATVERGLKRGYWELKKSLRKPGTALVEHPEEVWRKFSCGHRKRPFAKIVSYELVPLEAYAGEEINQHFEYVFCPARPAQVLSGVLYRRVYFKGRVVFQDVTRNFELKPGRWAVDAFIRIPPKASPGVYYVEVRFSGRINLKAGENLVLRPKAR